MEQQQAPGFLEQLLHSVTKLWSITKKQREFWVEVSEVIKRKQAEVDLYIKNEMYLNNEVPALGILSVLPEEIRQEIYFKVDVKTVLCGLMRSCKTLKNTIKEEIIRWKDVVERQAEKIRFQKITMIEMDFLNRYKGWKFVSEILATDALNSNNSRIWKKDGWKIQDKKEDSIEWYVGDESHNGFARLKYSNGNIYEGEIILTTRSGKGKLVLTTGELYDGDWRDNKRNGYGKNTWPDGETYEGDWKDNKRNGKGRNQWSSGEVYEGEYKSNNREGFGVIRCANGDMYVGEWKNDSRHGQGKFTCQNGDSYDGGWRHAQKHGHGKYTWGNGAVYEGEWVDNKIKYECDRMLLIQ